MRVAVCQVNSRHDRAANLAAAHELLERAAGAGVDLAVLPEYVDYLGPADGEPAPEPVDGDFATSFADAARRLRMWVVAGSFHEVGPDEKHTYNTASSSTARAGPPRSTARSTSSTSTCPDGWPIRNRFAWHRARRRSRSMSRA